MIRFVQFSSVLLIVTKSWSPLRKSIPFSVNHPKDDGAGRYHSRLKTRGHGKKWTYCLVLNVDTLDKFTWMYNSLYKTTNILTEKTISFQTLETLPSFHLQSWITLIRPVSFLRFFFILNLSIFAAVFFTLSDLKFSLPTRVLYSQINHSPFRISFQCL